MQFFSCHLKDEYCRSTHKSIPIRIIDMGVCSVALSLEESIGTTLKKYRTAKNLTQEQLAFESDVDRTFIGMVERAERNVSVNVLFKICKILNVKVSDFMGEVEELINDK